MMAVACFQASAQTLKIHKTDGSVIEIPTTEVDYLDFDAPSTNAPIYVGDWKVAEYEYTPDAIAQDVWSGMITFEGWPTLNAADALTISEDKMATSLQSELKNFFQPESGLKPAGEMVLTEGIGIKTTLTLVELDNVNRYFSATEQSEDKVALVGFAVNPDDENLLNMYLIDYNSHSFAYPDFDEFGMYNAEKPTATMTGMYVKLTLERK